MTPFFDWGSRGSNREHCFLPKKLPGQRKQHRFMIIFKTETKNRNRLHVKHKSKEAMKLRLFIQIWKYQEVLLRV